MFLKYGTQSKTKGIKENTVLPIAVPDHFRIIAHRGASAYAPENTHAAFALAARMGVTEVELDTQLTLDGEIALCHDATLERYGHGPRLVEQMAWQELADLDMGSCFSPFLHAGERMITLDDLFAAYGSSFTYHVEIKGKATGLPTAVQTCIQYHHLRDHCFITSFRYDALVAMRELDADLPLGWLVQRIDDDIVAKAEAIQLYQLCPRASLVTPEQVEQARTVAREVRAWGLQGESTENQSAELIRLIHHVVDCGCDGMTINWPDWVRHVS
jgi:glycerophosphoryl diester phosphodiesterase